MQTIVPPRIPAYTMRNELACGLVNKRFAGAGEVCRCDAVVCGAVTVELHTVSVPKGFVTNAGRAIVGSPSGPP